MTSFAEQQKRGWVNEFWADQMRKQNAPDLPEGLEGEKGIALFNDQSQRLADFILNKGPVK